MRTHGLALAVSGILLLLLAQAVAGIDDTSSDQNTVVSPGDDGTGNTGGKTGVGMVPTTVVTINGDGRLQFQNGSIITIMDLGDGSKFNSVAWNPFGTYGLAVGNNGVIIRFDGPRSYSILESLVKSDLTQLSWKPISGNSETYALIIGTCGTILKYDGDMVFRVPNELGMDLSNIIWNSDGTSATMTGQDGTVMVHPPPLNVAPAVRIKSPLVGETLTATVSVEGTAVDRDGSIIKVELRVDDGTWSKANGKGSWTWSLDTKAFGNGPHKIYARAYDGIVNSEPVVVDVAIFNNDIPSIEITAPSPGAIVAGTLYVFGNAMDPDGPVTQVEVSVDNGPWTPAAGTEYWSWAFETLKYGNGVHRISVQASDGFGLSDVAFIEITVNNINYPPEATIDSPTFGEVFTTGDLVTFKATAVDPEGDALTFKWISHTRGVIREEKTVQVLFPIGTHEVTLVVSDGMNEVQRGVRFEVVDMGAGSRPSVTISSPMDRDVVRGIIKVTGATSGGQEIQTIKVSIDDGPWRLMDGSSSWTYGWDTTKVANGPHKVSVKVFDGEMNSDPATVHVTVDNDGAVQAIQPPSLPKAEPPTIPDDPMGVDENSWGVIATVTITLSIFGLLVSAVEPLKYLLLKVFLLPLYTRLEKSEVLDNFTRGAIYGFVVANPGAHFNLIKLELRLNNGAIIYHLDILEKEGFISSEKSGIYKRFYANGQQKKDKMNWLTDVQRRIVEAIKTGPGKTQKDLASIIGLSARALNYHIKCLLKLEVIKVTRMGRFTKCYIMEDGNARANITGDGAAGA